MNEEEVQPTVCTNPGFCQPVCVACETMAKEFQQKLRVRPRECPPGVHSIFDFCPGNCTEPVEDEHETFVITWATNIGDTLAWLHRHRADWEPMALSDPIWRWGIVQPDQDRFAAEPTDVLCWDGTRVWLHSSRRQEVETCEAKEAHMLKFGTGQITAVTDGIEEKLPPRTGRALTPEEQDAIVTEGAEDHEGE
ncbi:hypothetical protein ACPCSE_29865 [Streptomyces cellulosae]